VYGVFYGTGDAGGIPNPFCKCSVCENARLHGGNEIRKRSMFRLGSKVLIDFGPDIATSACLYGDLSEIRHILITHTHHDHLSALNLLQLMWAARRQDKISKVNIYFTDKAYDIVKCWSQSSFINKGMTLDMENMGIYKFHRLEYYKKYLIDDFSVIPLKGNHIGNVSEHSANYLIELPNGKTLFYGLDSYLYFNETFEFLKDYKLDYYITEATGIGTDEACLNKNHLNRPELVEVFNNLYNQHTINEFTKVYLSHISHGENNDIKSITSIINQLKFPYLVTLAYDGLKIKL
jgi:beta-lactamase domain protein